MRPRYNLSTLDHVARFVVYGVRRKSRAHFSPWTVPLGRCDCRSKRKEMHGEQISATSSSNAIGHCGDSRRNVYCGLCCRV